MRDDLDTEVFFSTCEVTACVKSVVASSFVGHYLRIILVSFYTVDALGPDSGPSRDGYLPPPPLSTEVVDT